MYRACSGDCDGTGEGSGMKYELNKLYNVDCVEAMKEIPDKYFELAIVDPPYGIGINHNMGRRKGDKKSDYKKVIWDDKAPEAIYFEELQRVSKNQIIWGANRFISRNPVDSSCWIVWDKLFSEEVSFASVELAWTSFKTVAKRIALSSKQSDRIHPTQKPVALYKWLLNNYAKKGDKILDTHVGSASSLIACYDMGFDYLGFELDKDYYNAATERIKNHKSQIVFEEVRQLGL